MDNWNHRLFKIFHRFHQLQRSDLMPEEISRNDFATLMCIEHVGNKSESFAVSISTLAKALMVSTPAVSRTIRGLEERGLVLREIDTKDRRNTFVKITDRGKNILRLSEQKMNDFTSTVMKNMKQEDMERLLEYLEQFLDTACEELERRKKQKKERNLYEQNI